MQDFMHEEEHRMFRDSFREFVQREVVPHEERWTHGGIASREVWRKAGENGFFPQGDAKRSMYGCARGVWRVWGERFSL